MFLLRTVSKPPQSFDASDLFPGIMIDSRGVTWASITPLTSVSCEQGGLEPTELQKVESMEVETDASNEKSDEL